MAMDVQVHFDIDPAWSARDIVEHADGSCSVDDVTFTSLEAAHAHIRLRNELDLTLARLQELERDVEKVLALREDFRAAARDLIDDISTGPHDAAELLFTQLHEDAVTGLAASLRKSERAVEGQLDDAAALRRDFPATHVAWMDGEIHLGHVRVISNAAHDLPPELLPDYEARVLEAARTRTPAQLGRVAARIARELAGPATPEAVDQAARDRAVWLTQHPDGMTHLTIKTTPVLAAAAYDRLRQAFQHRDRGDERGLHQHLSDTAMRLLITGTTPPVQSPRGDEPGTQDRIGALSGGFMTGINARVTVTMPATLLTYGRTLDGRPGPELPDGTLIDDNTALLLAAGATSWTRLFTDPVTGVAITADTYQPTASLRRLIIGRDQTCRFPGCHRPATNADLDHTIDWQYGGDTTPGNLAALCRRHHVVKHRAGPRTGWTVQQTGPGELLWLGPQDNLHRVTPEPIPTAISPPDGQGRTRTLNPWKPPPEPPITEEFPF